MNSETCIICFVKFDDVFTITQCDRCKSCVCLQCSWNELRGLCAVCDREELNEESFCEFCRTNYRIGKSMCFECENCCEEIELCLYCYEHWKCSQCYSI